MGREEENRFCLLALSSMARVGPVSIRALIRAAERRGSGLREVLALPERTLVGECGIGAEVARAIATLDAPALAGEEMLDHMDGMGVCVLFQGDSCYPRKLGAFLGDQAPVVLFLRGEPALLRRPCVAVVGSRRPSKPACEAARCFVEYLCRGGMAIVSGGARGIDTIAHQGGLRHGLVLVVPADGLARFRWRGVGEEELAGGNWCVVGQFPPDSPWRSGQALVRNRTIVALADAVMAFEPRDSGGTWQAAVTALAMGKPLFVASAAAAGAKSRGLRRLVRAGAVALEPQAMPDGEEFLRMVAGYTPPPPATQSWLLNAAGE